MGYEGIDVETLAKAFPWVQAMPLRALEQLRTERRYSGYLARQEADIRSFRRDEAIGLAASRSKISEDCPGSCAIS